MSTVYAGIKTQPEMKKHQAALKNVNSFHSSAFQ